MKTRVLIIIPIIIGVAISLPFIISNMSGGTHYTQDIDPRITQVTNGFAIASNMDVYSITVEDEMQAIIITTSKNIDGFIHMDDPLPILQKLFPDKNIVSIAVLSDGVEIPYTLEDGKLGMSVNNAQIISIIGFSKI
ncbi:hypothetical protein [Nitrosopumilus sp. b3]|uniref:hypothetical protein n=1 Tax=Nitrosopumilus sp. b3 TaxID=2109909 RepID=UPI0015F3D577|nr:hypothetical protein [Nitrosopumilus sp. b3]